MTKNTEGPNHGDRRRSKESVLKGCCPKQNAMEKNGVGDARSLGKASGDEKGPSLQHSRGACSNSQSHKGKVRRQHAASTKASGRAGGGK